MKQWAAVLMVLAAWAGTAMAVGATLAQFSFQFDIQGRLPPTPLTTVPEAVAYIESMQFVDEPVGFGSILYGQNPGEPFESQTSIGEVEKRVRVAAEQNGRDWHDYVFFANQINRIDGNLGENGYNLARVMVSRAAVLSGPSLTMLPNGRFAVRITVNRLGAPHDLFVYDPVPCLVSQQMNGWPVLRPWPIRVMPMCGWEISVSVDDLAPFGVPR